MALDCALRNVACLSHGSCSSNSTSLPPRPDFSLFCTLVISAASRTNMMRCARTMAAFCKQILSHRESSVLLSRSPSIISSVSSGTYFAYKP
nr:MAG TPA: hypothetical protein [Caudoviricetes sp.]